MAMAKERKEKRIARDKGRRIEVRETRRSFESTRCARTFQEIEELDDQEILKVGEHYSMEEAFLRARELFNKWGFIPRIFSSNTSLAFETAGIEKRT